MMDQIAEKFLYELYYKTNNGDFLSSDEIEVILGLRGSLVQMHSEDLRTLRFLIETNEGYQISQLGVDYCRSRLG